MTAHPSRRQPFRLSLRGMLIGVAAVAVAFASMRYANQWWHIAISTFVLAAFTAATIVALLDRGTSHAFALGMVAVMIIYAASILNARIRTSAGGETNPEFYGGGRLATSRLLGFIYNNVAVVKYVDFKTGKEIPNYAPRRFSVAVPVDRAHQSDFMRTGHAWCALLLGYIGGQFARTVYLRRPEVAEFARIQQKGERQNGENSK